MLTLPEDMKFLSASTSHYEKTCNCYNTDKALLKHSMRMHNFLNRSALAKTLTVHKIDCCCFGTVQKKCSKRCQKKAEDGKPGMVIYDYI